MKNIIRKILSLNTKQLCLAIFFIALLPRFCWFFVKARHLPITDPAGGDAVGYDQLAVNLIKYHQYAFEPGKPTAYREPVYPYFLAIVYSIFGLSNYNAVRVVQIFVSALSCVLVFLLAKDLFDKKAATLASFISCFWPHFIFYSTTILRETLFCFLLLCCVYFLNKVYKKKFNFLSVIFAGIFCSLCALINSSSLVFLFFSFLIFLVLKRYKEFITILMIFIFLYSIWVIRNYKVFNTIVLGSTVGGFTLYYSTVVPYEIAGTEKEYEFRKKDPVFSYLENKEDEIYVNKYFLKSAFKVIIKNPKEYFLRCVKRFIKFYRIYPHRGRGYIHSEILLILSSLLSFGLILPFFILSFVLLLKNVQNYIFIYLPIFSFTLVYSLIWAVIRYRLPIEPYIIIFSSYGIIEIVKKCGLLI